MLGETISHYRILASLGQGGMGDVFLARDTVLDRKVALKFLAHEMQKDPRARKRFLREAKSAAALDHPYICKIYEAGEDQKKSFIAMEYVQGATLKVCMAKGPVTLKEALETAVEIAEALEEAHKQKIVHRDIKPSNIMLTVGGHVKVMDFGLAKQLAAAEGQEQEMTADLTQEGSAIGTVPYMSPEQLRGHPLDTRSDIFSFGVLLYEMVAGVHPFQKRGAMDTAQAILGETPPPVARYLNDVPELLQHVLKKMLSKEPDSRYQLIHEVRTDLEELSRMIDSGGEKTLRQRDQEMTRPLPDLAETSSVPALDVDRSADPDRGKRSPPKRLYYVGAGSVCLILLVLILGLSVPKKTSEPLPLLQQILTPSGVMVRVAVGESLRAAGEGGEVGSSDFFMDRYEVTNRLFKQFCDESGRSYPPDPEMITEYFLGKPDFPVVNITWEEATAFAAWAGKHLPSLQEWEMAAGSSDDRPWPWGNEPPIGQANLGGKEDGSEFMTSVAAFPLDVSPYGVEQMAGNVAEWTVNFDPGLLKKVPVIKGGSWVNRLADYGKISPVVARFKPESRRRMDGVGFRCAASSEEIDRFLQRADRGRENP